MTVAHYSGSVHRSTIRFTVMVVAGVFVGLGVSLAGFGAYSVIAGWAAASLTYIVWVWAIVGPMSAEQVQLHAARDDPGRGTSDLMVICASAASLVAVAFVLIQARDAHGPTKDLLAGLAVASVVLSWFLVHTLFTLRYARQYYSGQAGGINFNQDEKPGYLDFAYLAFSIGMTFQVSDTNLESSQIRATALRHALLSYLFGSVILATTINVVAGLAS